MTENVDEISDEDIDEESGEQRLDEDIRRIRQLMESDDSIQLQPSGVSQADRIIDKINELARSVDENGTSIDKAETSISSLKTDIDPVQSDIDNLRSELENKSREFSQRFDNVDVKLEDISQNTGVQLPEGTRKQVSLTIALVTGSFALLTFINDPSPLSTETIISASVSIGLIVPPVIRWIR